MNIELICWIIVFFIVWELIYIYRVEKDEDYGWVESKILSFLITSGFIFFQFGVITNFEGFINVHYIHLLYEAGIIIFILVFFYLNEKLAGWIEKMNENKVKRAKTSSRSISRS